jgi:hypothetical protein
MTKAPVPPLGREEGASFSNLLNDWFAENQEHYFVDYSRASTKGGLPVKCECVDSIYYMGWVFQDRILVWKDNALISTGKQNRIILSAGDPLFFDKLVPALEKWHVIIRKKIDETRTRRYRSVSG